MDSSRLVSQHATNNSEPDGSAATSELASLLNRMDKEKEEDSYRLSLLTACNIDDKDQETQAHI